MVEELSKSHHPTKPLKVHAFDPGITTGHASGIIEDGKLGVVSGQDKWNEYQLFLQLEFTHPDIIVYERFEYRSQAAYNVDNAELFPRNLIGVINLYCQKREADNDPLVEVKTFMPANVLPSKKKNPVAQNYWTNDRLKKARVYKVANPHANDAMRHLLYWWQFGPGFRFNTNGFEPLA